MGSGESAKNFNSSDTRNIVGEYARASAEDTKAAVAAAKAAFPAWTRSSRPASHRHAGRVVMLKSIFIFETLSQYRKSWRKTKQGDRLA